MLTTAKIALALAAGNTVVIKPSEHTSASLLKLVPLFEEAGFPPGTVKLVTGYGADAGDALVHHPQGVKISFTGSTQTGSRIATACGSRFVPVTLELGGKSPNIVFNDADTDSARWASWPGSSPRPGRRASPEAACSSSEVCTTKSSTRSRHARPTIKIGDPLSDDTELGLWPSPSSATRSRNTCDWGAARAARCCTAAYAPNSTWTVTSIPHRVCRHRQQHADLPRGDLRAVLTVMSFDTEAEVVALADDTSYGLAAGVWTRDLARAHRLVSTLEAGTVWVNTYR
jgi:acyl-CoA reductase-like NAD-dependent aldehyde dehydrogenase